LRFVRVDAVTERLVNQHKAEPSAVFGTRKCCGIAQDQSTSYQATERGFLPALNGGVPASEN
jgi:hypothetical protein